MRSGSRAVSRHEAAVRKSALKEPWHMTNLEKIVLRPTSRYKISISSALQPCILLKSSHSSLFVKGRSSPTNSFTTPSLFLALPRCTGRFGQMERFGVRYTRLGRSSYSRCMPRESLASLFVAPGPASVESLRRILASCRVSIRCGA